MRLVQNLGQVIAVTTKTNEIVDPDNPENTLSGISFVVATLLANSVFQKFSYCEILNPYFTSEGLEHVDERTPLVAPDEEKLADSLDFRLRKGVRVVEVERPVDDTGEKKQA